MACLMTFSARTTLKLLCTPKPRHASGIRDDDDNDDDGRTSLLYFGDTVMHVHTLLVITAALDGFLLFLGFGLHSIVFSFLRIL